MEDPREAVPRLESALAEVARHPEQFANSDRQEVLRQARFTLVWSQLQAAEGPDHGPTVASMDDAIRSAGEAPPPKSYFDPSDRDIGFGPEFADLYAARRAALEAAGTAKIAVTCSACRVFVNEHETPGQGELHETGPLYLGDYRVVIVWGQPDAGRSSATITLDQQGTTRAWSPATPLIVPAPEPERGEESKGAEQPKVAAEPAEEPRPDGSNAADTQPRRDRLARGKSDRLLLRPIELAGVGVGLGLTIIGAVLLALDERCPGGGDITDLDECPRVYDNKPQGYALIGVGAATMLSMGVVLTIDEVRASKAKRGEAMLVWTFRF